MPRKFSVAQGLVQTLHLLWHMKDGDLLVRLLLASETNADVNTHMCLNASPPHIGKRNPKSSVLPGFLLYIEISELPDDIHQDR